MIPAGSTIAARFATLACLSLLYPVSVSSLPTDDPASDSAQVTVKRGPATHPSELASATLRVDVPLVVVPVHVSTALGAPVTNLGKDDFRIFEDKVEQTVTHFSKEDAAVSVGLLFDASGSMRDKMRKSSEAAGQCLSATNPEDEFFLTVFSERPKLSLSF